MAKTVEGIYSDMLTRVDDSCHNMHIIRIKRRQENVQSFAKGINHELKTFALIFY